MTATVPTIQSDGSVLSVSSDGSTFYQVPGVSSWDESGGEPDTRDVVAWDGTYSRVGSLGVPDVTVEMPKYIPYHVACTTIRGAYIANTPLTWRIVTQEEEVYAASGSSNTAAIATTGIVTFAGTSPDFTTEFGVGYVLEVNSVKYAIVSVSAAGVVTVTAPSAAVTATSGWKILIPSVRRGASFVGRVSSFDNTSMPSEGDMSTTITIKPATTLPAWEIV